MKKIFTFFFICLIFIIFSHVDRNFLETEIFYIEEVSLEGDVDIISEELEKGIALLTGNLIWDIDTKKIEEILEEDVRIKKATVKKEIPNKLRIKIESERPKYYILYKNEIYSLDKEYNIFSYLEEFPLKDYPILSIQNMEEIEELIKVLERIKGKQLSYLVSQLYIEDENCIKMILLDGTVIKTRQDVLGEKYDLLERLYLNLKTGETLLEYIDIRFGDYIVK